MSSAQLEISGDQAVHAIAEGHAPGALRAQMAERIAQHRQRRGRHGHASAMLFEDSKATGRKKIASAVAERYAHSPSYRAFLAEEAQKAVQQAAAAADVAMRNAEAVSAAQQDLLAELELWTAPQEFTAGTAEVSKATADEPVKQISAGGITVKLYEDFDRGAIRSFPMKNSAAIAQSLAPAQLDDEEYLALDEEIEFRKQPVFDSFRDYSTPVEPIAANLLEFPRQLVAAKRVRPRLAEGPLRDDAVARSPQLRIFEVDADQISVTPPAMPSAPEWKSIHLDAHAAAEHVGWNEDGTAILPSVMSLHTAAVSQRAMAATVDFTILSATFLAFAAMSAYVARTVPTGINAVTTSAVLFAVLYLCYQLIFFTFSDQTPGMRYARIGLCTFTDENPSRSAMRKRILATLVAAAPFGIGLLWVWMDDERLGWHDRISQMYQRSY